MQVVVLLGEALEGDHQDRRNRGVDHLSGVA